MKRILVVYATKHGSTREVAERIAATMHDCGAQVHVAATSSAWAPVSGWDLVVLGAPLYSGRWHRDAHRFLVRHREDLRTVPVAVFGMGSRRDDEDAWQRSRAQLDRALARRPWLVPVATGLFGGVDPSGRHRSGHPPGRDLRDWAEIGRWARKVFAVVDGSR